MTVLFLIVAAIVALDQGVKLWALNLKTMPAQTYPVWENVFHLTYTENTGAAFSMFSGMQLGLIIFTCMTSLVLIIYIWKNHHKLNFKYRLALGFILGGALGNLIDRIRLNYVIDMFDFRLIRFAVFNVADIFLCLGVALLFVLILLEPEQPRKQGERK